ncbi:MAG TPA: TIM barrel protein [Caldilineaceae bacterium]|nr:TIM barrel protein [Caldilineaceae bacterium]
MIHFDLNLSFTLRDRPLLDAFQQAADLGFDAVEFFWPAADIELDAIVAAKEAAGVEVALFNMDAGNMAAGDRGFLSHPERRDWWREAMLRAIALAERLGCRRIHAVAGARLPGVERSEQIACAVENLRWALPHLERAGVVATVEALNAYDNPTFLITRMEQMLDICRQVNSPHVRCQYDIYHMQRMEGNLIPTLQEHLPWIGHVQIADAPWRHEPGSGEINFRNVLAALDEAGYSGYVGLEYIPRGSVEASLAWLPREARRTATADMLRL